MPTFEFIFWLCLASNPTCDRYHSIGHYYQTVYGAPSRKDCEEDFAKWDTKSPNPPGTVSNHICQPVSEEL